jgi:pyruvate dehydrogenase E1 component
MLGWDRLACARAPVNSHEQTSPTRSDHLDVITNDHRARPEPGFVEACPSGTVDHAALEEIQRRVLWLAVRMVDYANHERLNLDGIKVGGHQASSASMVSIMTALWFTHLRANDYVSVKPHASPVLHAINYLLGNLDRRYLTTLRAFGGLQAYPSRSKDPDRVDYSTGSVGLGAVAPLFGAVVSKYLACHLNAPEDRRFIAILGDAELDEGNVWEAIADPVTSGYGNVMWIVDLNRQSLDRVVPGIRATAWEQMFAANGWQVLEAKYGRLLQSLFAQPGGDALRAHLDAMSNEQYQSLFGLPVDRARGRFLDGADASVVRLASELDDETLRDAVTNLGGHDLVELSRCYETAAADDRPSVVFAYTIKGWGLPIAGDRLNHAALLNAEQIDHLRTRLGIDPATEWETFPAGTAPARVCEATTARLHRAPVPRADLAIAIPAETNIASAKPISTQEAFGRVLTGLAREPELMKRLVTASPDVTISTNLGGWVNKAGVFAPHDTVSFDDRPSVLRWQQDRHGQHLELGISEMNLFLLLGQLGMAGEMFGEPLIPIGTVYDPFVLRGLDAFVYATYIGSKFIVAGTPSGVTLSYEGGAHQSILTPSVGSQLPNIAYVEPTYARELDWLLCDAAARVLRPNGESTYLRLSTRPIDQAPLDDAIKRLGDAELRRQVISGGYCLRESRVAGPVVNLAASGAVMPEVLQAAEILEDEDVHVRVVNLTSTDRLFRSWRADVRHAVTTSTRPDNSSHIGTLFPAHARCAPIVAVQDAAPQTLAWLGSVYGSKLVPLGTEHYGQSGSLADTYHWHQLDSDAIVNAALHALDDANTP